MPISTNIQIIVVALLNVLLAFSCGAVFGAWIAGHTPDLWTVVLPACILLVFFAPAHRFGVEARCVRKGAHH
jgi:uncharacterized membrane protein YoaK (UPF0700 family)